MAGLYEADKTLKMPDYHTGIVRSVSLKDPLIAALEKGGMAPASPHTAPLAQWSEELEGEHADPAVAEGVDKTTGFGSYVPETLGVYWQPARSAGWLVTKEATLTDSAYRNGKADAAYQRAKDAENFLLSIGKVLAGTQETRAPAAGVAALTRSIPNWLLTTAQAVQPVPATCRPTAGYASTMALFTEDVLQDELAKAVAQVNRDLSLTAYVGLALKTHMSLFNNKIAIAASTEASTVSVTTTPGKRQMKVDFFEYDSVLLKVFTMHRMFCDMSSSGATTAKTTRSGFFIDPEQWKLEWIQRITHFAGLNQGGGERGWHEAVCRLRCWSPRAQFKVEIES